MVKGGFKRKNVPAEYLKALKQSKKSRNKNKDVVPTPDDLDWSYVISNTKLLEITKTSPISNFCKTQHMKYLAHVTRLGNDSFQKQILFLQTIGNMLVTDG